MAHLPTAALPPDPPRLGDDPDDLRLGPEAIETGASLSAVRVADADLAGARARGLSLVDARLDRVDLSGATLPALHVVDAVVSGGNLANLGAPELSLRRVVVTGARLTGAQWTRGRIGDALFRDCR